MIIYDNNTIEQINNSINIVDYAKRYLNLEFKYGEWWTNCPFHLNDDTPSLSFNQEKNVFKCLGCGLAGSVIQFVQNYHKLSFPKAIEHLINYGNLNLIPKEYSNVLNFLYKTKSQNKSIKTIQRDFLPDNYMERYSKKPIKEWLNEGIKQEILDKYEVRYDKHNRIVFPIKNIEGKIIAIKGRTLYSNYKDLGIPKYIYYQKIITNDFLFGLYENLSYIKEKNEVIVFEGAKGVMLAESYGFNNVVSLETNKINKYQKNLLLQLKVNIVFALDKGIKIVTKKINKIKNDNNIYVNIGLLPKLTNVYVIEDKKNLLEEKECPCDQGKEVWEILYEGKILI